MGFSSLVLYNATVHTLDPTHPRASLIAVRKGCITFLGDARDLDRLRGPGVHCIDCQGGSVVPGFHDAHLHLLGLAARLVSLDCTPKTTPSLAALKEAVRHRTQGIPAGQWVRGWGYDETALIEGRHPTRHDLDETSSQHPVRLIHRSGHAAVLNTLALQCAGITRETSDPPEGVIERDAHGEPTGLLLEMDAYLEERIPPLSLEELSEGMRRADAWLLSHGITTVHDASPGNDLSRWHLLRRFKEEGTLTPRALFMPGVRGLDGFLAEGLHYGSGDRSLWLGPAKVFPTMTTGAMVPSTEELRVLAQLARDAGFPVAVHAVENEVVEAAAEVIRTTGSPPGSPLRHRIEHASELSPSALGRVVESGAVVVTNPGFLFFGGERYRSEVAPEVQPWLYRIGSLQRRGVPLAFGSDAPVEMPATMAELYAAVTRRSARGVPLSIEEGITADEALRAHTVGGAHAAGAESWLGALKPGMAADLVVLDRDPFVLQPEALREVMVQTTIVDGQVVWSPDTPYRDAA